MRRLLRALAIHWTIKGRIAFAFAAMGIVSVALGVSAVIGANRAGQLVERTFDETLVSNSYARAAAGDFAGMQASVARAQLAGSDTERDKTNLLTAVLHDSFVADLSTAVEKSGMPQITAAAATLLAAESDWFAAARRIGATSTAADWTNLPRKARSIDAQVEAVVSQVSDQGAAFKADAQQQIAGDVRFAIEGVAAALGVSGLLALILYWRISAPFGTALRFAREIAAGGLDGEAPRHGVDEIGELIAAMVSMRGEIGAMMDEQVVLRETSQARLGEAFEGSADGVVIVDADGVIQMANGRALDCLGVPRREGAHGRTVAQVLAGMQRADPSRGSLLVMHGLEPESEEMQLPDGRWIRNSRTRTAEGGLAALYTDITAIKDQQARLAEANLTLDAALGNMSQGLCLFDADNRLKLANSRFRTLFELSQDDVAPGTPYQTLVTRILCAVDGPLPDTGRLIRHEGAMIRRRRSFSRSVALGARTIAITQRRMREGGWIGTYEDVTERKRAESQIAFMASHDSLTRLPNRTMFAARVAEAITRARRGAGFAILCLDLDHFKQVNDTLGHAIGDQLLMAVTDRLQTCVGAADTVARLGGDEFAILQADTSEPEQTVNLCRQIIDTIGAPYVIEGREIQVGTSIGIALAPKDGLDHGVLLKSADAALYRAKEEGRSTWRFFEAVMDETLQARLVLETDLRHALVNAEFEVFFQPLLDVASGQIRSFEALARWRHPTRGLVSPDQFIPIAEDSGAIRDIGRWVLRAACTEAARWPANIRVAVNVSTIQLRDVAFVETVAEALAEAGLTAERLELEVTESVFIASTATVVPILTRLRAAGVRFAMDDFGTGYSSLSSLRSFPFDKIKIDRSFIRDLAAADTAGQIIRTIVALGRSLGMRVTAEGVETRTQARFLEAEGCDEIQGYLLGRPMPRHEVLPWLRGEGARREIEMAA